MNKSSRQFLILDNGNLAWSPFFHFWMAFKSVAPNNSLFVLALMIVFKNISSLLQNLCLLPFLIDNGISHILSDAPAPATSHDLF